MTYLKLLLHYLSNLVLSHNHTTSAHHHFCYARLKISCIWTYNSLFCFLHFHCITLKISRHLVWDCTSGFALDKAFNSHILSKLYHSFHSSLPYQTYSSTFHHIPFCTSSLPVVQPVLAPHCVVSIPCRYLRFWNFFFCSCNEESHSDLS